MSHEIITILSEHNPGGPEGARFVFHSETAALFWAQKALTLFQLKTIARERFTAWDMFKAEQLSVHIAGKKAVSPAVRLLFAHALCAENAGGPFFNTLIPAEYARDGQLFAKNIASMLSSLRLWRKKEKEACARASSGWETHDFAAAGFHDLAILEQKYAAFLEKHHLFENSWEKPPFKDKEHEYFIFYPGLIGDFAEYEELLDVANVHKITPAPYGGGEAQLLLYDQARAELRACALELRRLHETGINYEDMALSAGNLEELEPYIKREFHVFNIPYSLRSGKPLSAYGAGSLFSKIADCAAQHFSWVSLEALLTTSALPWRTPNKNRALLSFGIRHNCVWSYRERGKKKDIWEEAFYPFINPPEGAAHTPERTACTGGKAEVRRLYRHYQKLKRAITRMAAADSFAGLLTAGKRFADRFFKKLWSEDISALIGRCLNELSGLAVLEAQCPELTADAPLTVFCAFLQDKIHVTHTEKAGVNLFAYGVAASIPAQAHFIINANQTALTKLHRTLPYLRQDTRRLLSVEDADISRELIESFRQRIALDGRANITRWSASRRTFSGAEIPHSYFNRRAADGDGGRLAVPVLAPAEDPYAQERNWWRSGEPFPALIFPAQKQGFTLWSFFADRARRGGFLEAPVPSPSAAAALITGAIDMIKRKDHGAPHPDGRLRVSATSLNAFFTCPVYWLYRDIFKLKPLALRPRMLDEQSMGLLYHAILCELFSAIRRNGGVFQAAQAEDYRSICVAAARQKAKSLTSFRGPLAAPLIGAMARALARNIIRMLEREAALRDGWLVAALEEAYSEERGAALLTGVLDRVSLSPEYAPCVIDYKTGKIPAKAACLHSGEAALQDFQIPLYIRLYEAASGAAVEQACFMHPVRGEARFVVKPDGRDAIDRGAYQPALDALERFIDRHIEAVGALDFTPREARNAGGLPEFSRRKIPLSSCFQCIYRTVCRTTN